MNLFVVAYKAPRRGTKTIYKGFGFKHLSDISPYSEHDVDATPLCQAAAEGILLLAGLLTECVQGTGEAPAGNYWATPEGREVYLEMDIPEDYRDNRVVAEKIHSYKAHLKEGNLALVACDRFGQVIPGKMEEVNLLYKLLPAFAILAVREMERNPRYMAAMEKFMDAPAPDTFVPLHEELYRKCMDEDFCMVYGEVPSIDRDAMVSFSERNTTLRRNRTELDGNPAVPIDRFSHGEFSSENTDLIPNLPTEFALPPRLRSVCNAIRHGDVLSALFHGPAGTGKTMACKLVCQAIGLPLMETINCTENLDEFVLGKFLPEGRAIVFRESQVAKAVREGGAVVFEEINFAKPQYLAFLNSLLDDNGFVRLDNGEVIRRHRHFRFFATMNLGYFGTKELNQALYNRFNAIVELAELGDEAIERMLLARVPECRPMIAKMLGVYHKLRKRIGSDELEAVISPRNLENWARMAKYEGYVAAAEKSVVSIAKSDRPLEQAIRDVVMLYKWS